MFSREPLEFRFCVCDVQCFRDNPPRSIQYRLWAGGWGSWIGAQRKVWSKFFCRDYMKPQRKYRKRGRANISWNFRVKIRSVICWSSILCVTISKHVGFKFVYVCVCVRARARVRACVRGTFMFRKWVYESSVTGGMGTDAGSSKKAGQILCVHGLWSRNKFPPMIYNSRQTCNTLTFTYCLKRDCIFSALSQKFRVDISFDINYTYNTYSSKLQSCQISWVSSFYSK